MSFFCNHKIKKKNQYDSEYSKLDDRRSGVGWLGGVVGWLGGVIGCGCVEL